MSERNYQKIALAAVLSVLATGVGIYSLQWYLKTVSNVFGETERRIDRSGSSW